MIAHQQAYFSATCSGSLSSAFAALSFSTIAHIFLRAYYLKAMGKRKTLPRISVMRSRRGVLPPEALEQQLPEPARAVAHGAKVERRGAPEVRSVETASAETRESPREVEELRGLPILSDG